MGRPKKEFSDDDRAKIRELASWGAKDEQIARLFNCSEAHLKKKTKDELREGRTKGNFELLETAHNQAKKIPAVLIFLLKTRLGMREKDYEPDEPRTINIVFEDSPRGVRRSMRKDGGDGTT